MADDKVVGIMTLSGAIIRADAVIDITHHKGTNTSGQEAIWLRCGIGTDNYTVWYHRFDNDDELKAAEKLREEVKHELCKMLGWEVYQPKNLESHGNS